MMQRYMGLIVLMVLLGGGVLLTEEPSKKQVPQPAFQIPPGFEIEAELSEIVVVATLKKEWEELEKHPDEPGWSYIRKIGLFEITNFFKGKLNASKLKYKSHCLWAREFMGEIKGDSSPLCRGTSYIIFIDGPCTTEQPDILIPETEKLRLSPYSEDLAKALTETFTPKPKPELTVEIKKKIDLLIGQLGADDWKIRQAAQEELVNMGDAPLEILQKTLTESQDSEIKKRTVEIIEQITDLIKTLELPAFITAEGWRAKILKPIPIGGHKTYLTISHEEIDTDTGGYSGPDECDFSVSLELHNTGKKEIPLNAIVPIVPIELYEVAKRRTKRIATIDCVGNIRVYREGEKEGKNLASDEAFKPGEKIEMVFSKHLPLKDAPWAKCDKKIIVVITLEDSAGKKIKLRTPAFTII